MEKDQIIFVLLVLMALVLFAEFLYLFMKKKRRKEEMKAFRKPSNPVETMADKAHNTIVTTESISASLARSGVDTEEANTIIRQARKEHSMRDYGAAIERAEAAKIVLLRAKRERESIRAPRHQGYAGPTERPMDESVYDAREPVREERSLDSLPANYVQAKFMLNTAKDLLGKKGISSGQAYDFYASAVEAFKKEDYTKALSMAIKSEKLLDSETLCLIGEEKGAVTGEPAVEVLVCPGCDGEVSKIDAFCRKCGENLADAWACPGCGADIESVDMFCRKCGQKLKNSASDR